MIQNISLFKKISLFKNGYLFHSSGFTALFESLKHTILKWYVLKLIPNRSTKYSIQINGLVRLMNKEKILCLQILCAKEGLLSYLVNEMLCYVRQETL